MPYKNTTLLNGKRFNPINRDLHKRFEESSGVKIDYLKFVKIIQKTNEEFANCISSEPEGVQLPYMGYVCVSKYKGSSSKPPVDWVNSKKFKKFIPLLNLHTYGYIHCIKWFKIGALLNSNIGYWRFQPVRKLKRSLATEIKKGKKYFEWETSDLWSVSKLERRFQKHYKKKENGSNNP